MRPFEKCHWYAVTRFNERKNEQVIMIKQVNMLCVSIFLDFFRFLHRYRFIMVASSSNQSLLSPENPEKEKGS